MTQGDIASRCGLLSSEMFLKYVKPSTVLHAVFYITVQSSKMVTLLLPIFLESLPGYNVALCLNIAIKNKVSNDEIFTILKDVPNPNQDNDGKPV